ncbi:unnamed protein product, partial [Effrenium voratum]
LLEDRKRFEGEWTEGRRKSFNKVGVDGYSEPGNQMIELEMQRQQKMTLQLQQMMQEQQREIALLKSQLSVQEQAAVKHVNWFPHQAAQPQVVPSYVYNVSL